MSWDADRTAEYGAVRPVAPGHHRRQHARIVGVVAGAVLLALAVAGAMFSPVLTGWPAPDSRAGVTSSSTVDQRGLGPTPTTAATTGLPSAPPTARSTGAPAGVPALESRVVELTNAERDDAGCPALRLDLRLRTAARAYSNEMARYGTWGHTGRDGSTPGQRMARAGYNVDGGWAENIARGYASAEEVMNGWMTSTGHRANILNCGLRAVGVGVARASNGRLYWTQDFGTH
ncbi:MAG: CAP domain-containing protein [Micromonosporaceae bacterium]